MKTKGIKLSINSGKEVLDNDFTENHLNIITEGFKSNLQVNSPDDVYYEKYLGKGIYEVKAGNMIIHCSKSFINDINNQLKKLIEQKYGNDRKTT